MRNCTRRQPERIRSIRQDRRLPPGRGEVTPGHGPVDDRHEFAVLAHERGSVGPRSQRGRRLAAIRPRRDGAEFCAVTGNDSQPGWRSLQSRSKRDASDHCDNNAQPGCQRADRKRLTRRPVVERVPNGDDHRRKHPGRGDAEHWHRHARQ